MGGSLSQNRSALSLFATVRLIVGWHTSAFTRWRGWEQVLTIASVEERGAGAGRHDMEPAGALLVEGRRHLEVLGDH